MRLIIFWVICAILSGCIQTKNLDGSYVATVIQSDSSQRNSVLVSRKAGYMYCPDAPAEIARSYDGNGSATVKDVPGNNATATGALNALVVNLSNRNSATNVLVYSLNSLCFLAMNGSISGSEVSVIFKDIIKATTNISKAEITAAEAARNVTEAEKNRSEADKNETAKEKAKADMGKSYADAERYKSETKKIEAELQLEKNNLNKNLIN